MKASGKKFVCFIHQDDRRPDEWVGVVTWRLGYRGPFLVRGNNEVEVREKLRRLDPSIRFHQWRRLNPGGERKNEDASAN
jgi:hypothetical protein